jgi:hypothetical protein
MIEIINLPIILNGLLQVITLHKIDAIQRKLICGNKHLK